MMAMTENFRELSEKLGGFNPAALESFFYWNNPFTLKHWTMNIVELLMCAGAALGLLHALKIYKHTGNAINLCYWIMSIGFLFVTEVPLYFPTLVGADPNQLRFLHNEFTAGLVFDRMPIYIVALYPALMYPAYVLIARTGIFERKWGLLLGAVSVGFLHHCFYEIFDHYGPQFGWWVWNYTTYGATVASVPLASIYTFAFVGPMGLTLVTRLLVARYIRRRQAMSMPSNAWHLAGWCVIGSIAAFVPLVIFTPDLYYQIFLGAMPAPAVEQIVSFSILAVAAFITLAVNLKANTGSGQIASGRDDWRRYPIIFLAAYLVIFAALWICAFPEYAAASNGTTVRGTPIGSLTYTVGCYVLGLLILYLNVAPFRNKVVHGKDMAQPLANAVGKATIR
jgi:hypothetical protein